MKTARKIFGVLLVISGAVISTFIVLVFMLELYDARRYGTSIDMVWLFPLFLLVGVSLVLLGIRLVRAPAVKKAGSAKAPPVFAPHPPEGAEPPPLSAQTPEYKTFRSSPREQLKVFCFMVFFPALFPVLLVVLTNLNSLETTARVLKPVLSILLPFSVLLALPVSFITYNIRVEVGAFGLRFYRCRRMYADYSLDSGFSVPPIVGDRQRNYFVYAISVGHEDREEKRQLFFGFSRRDFWAAWDELNFLQLEAQRVNAEKLREKEGQWKQNT